MDGMPLTAEQIHTFCEDYNLQKLTNLLDDLVVKKYLSYEHPKQSINGKRIPDTNLDKGYNIVTGKLSFELNKIMDNKYKKKGTKSIGARLIKKKPQPKQKEHP